MRDCWPVAQALVISQEYLLLLGLLYFLAVKKVGLRQQAELLAFALSLSGEVLKHLIQSVGVQISC